MPRTAEGRFSQAKGAAAAKALGQDPTLPVPTRSSHRVRSLRERQGSAKPGPEAGARSLLGAEERIWPLSVPGRFLASSGCHSWARVPSSKSALVSRELETLTAEPPSRVENPAWGASVGSCRESLSRPPRPGLTAQTDFGFLHPASSPPSSQTPQCPDSGQEQSPPVQFGELGRVSDFTRRASAKPPAFAWAEGSFRRAAKKNNSPGGDWEGTEVWEQA